MTFSFRWTCSYLGTVDYEIIDHTGRYMAEVRWSLPDYALQIANGDDVRQEMRTSVGILRRSHGIGPDHDYTVLAETVDAFNAWQLAEHSRLIAQIDNNPNRYGVLPPDDPLRAPRYPDAKRGRYVRGESRWEVIHA